jgi:hypothetical protein
VELGQARDVVLGRDAGQLFVERLEDRPIEQRFRGQDRGGSAKRGATVETDRASRARRITAGADAETSWSLGGRSGPRQRAASRVECPFSGPLFSPAASGGCDRNRAVLIDTARQLERGRALRKQLAGAFHDERALADGADVAQGCHQHVLVHRDEVEHAEAAAAARQPSS